MNVQLAQAKALLTTERPNPDKAIKTLKPLLNKPNQHWLLHHYLGVAQLQKGQYKKAKTFLEDAFRYGSNEAETHHLMSVTHYNLGEYEDAIFHAKEAISRNSELVETWINLGAAYRAMADLDNAMKAYSKANQLNPSNAGIAYRIGSIYFDQGDLKKARELYSITQQVDPNFIEAYLGLCLVAQNLQDYNTALSHVNEAIERFPKSRVAKIQLAVVYKEMGRYSDAIELNRKLLLDKPNDGRLRINYALCLLETGQFDEAETNYLRALNDTPEAGESLSNYLMGIHYNPERTKQEIFDAHLLWDAHYAPKERKVRPVPQNIDPNKKLRVGFISGGFRKHPVGWMITRAIEHLPKDQFEIYCYTTHSSYDDLTARINKLCDKWVSVIGYSDEVVADLLRKDEVDILVELSGHSAFNRLKTVALEPVPITIKWVGGLFNTTGLQSMDYLLTDCYESSEGEEQFYTEKLVRMPDDYICYEPPPYDIKVAELPAKYNGYITFGCFNNPSKLNKEVLQKWAEILKSVPDSKLFLKSKQYDTPAFVEGIVIQMEKFGIGSDQLIFEGYAMHEDLLCSYNKVDIALDPWPYSGGLTTCESLWMGVPVISNQGPTFAGKHSATHLSNAGHPEWVTDNWAGYKAMVMQLAGDISALENLRASLRDELLNSPVCDGPRFGAHLSNAFREMWTQRVSGYENELPEGDWQHHITVEQLSQKKLNKFNKEHGFDMPKPFTQKNKVVELEGSLKISVPLYKENFTRYVLEEQQQWIDAEAAFLARIIPKQSTVIDVGAGFGVYALPLAKKVGENGCVFAFEPHADVATHLKESKRLNKFPQLEVIEKAVFKADGDFGFKHKGQVEKSALSLFQTNKRIATQTLDSFWQEFGEPPIHMIKIDVNGNEFEVLEGSKALIEATLPMILFAEPSASSQCQNSDFLAKNGYQFYELVPELGILSGFNNSENSFRKNLFALTEQHLQQFRELGVLFEDTTGEPPIIEGAGIKYLKTLPWAKTMATNWQLTPNNELLEKYFIALDAIGTALNMNEGQNVDKAHLLLFAAGTLFQLQSALPENVPLALTLARVLNILGKRQDAVDSTKQLTQRLLTGNPVGDLSLPFFPPLEMQDSGSIYSNPETWIKVKVAEAWLLLKDLSSYSFSAADLRYVKGLSGNPEVMEHINYLADEMVNNTPIVAKPDPQPVEEGKFIHLIQNHENAQNLAELIDEIQSVSGQQHLVMVEGNSQASFSDVVEFEQSVFNSSHDMEAVAAKCLSEDVDGIFIHGLFEDWQRKLIKSIGHQKHIGWVIMGEDLHTPINNGQPVRFLANFVNSIHTMTATDATLYKKEYGNVDHYMFSYSEAELLTLAGSNIVAQVHSNKSVA